MKLPSKISEMVLPPWGWFSGFGGIRSSFRAVGNMFWPKRFPTGAGTVVDYELTRSLYRSNGDLALGSGFCKPIVDLQVGFIGIPIAHTGDPNLDDFLNGCMQNHWLDEIQQLLRDSIRDSKIVARIHKPDILDPLMTLEEADFCRIEMISPERVSIERNLRNRNIIEKATILHRMLFIIDDGDPRNGREPREEEHEVLEIIDRRTVRFFDKNDNKELTDMTAENRDNFVPLIEIFNEWDASLQGGQSDLETVLPFIRAFHDLVVQGLQAHAYHSTPKVKLKLTGDLTQFIRNNFPESLDEDGSIKPYSEISWRGREIIFLQSEEDIGFLEATSVLGDTKILAEFLLDCICIAAQTPEWAFMRVDSGSANSDRNAQTVPFIKKIDRKRRNYTRPIQDLLKMAMLMSGKTEIPVRPNLSWDMVRVDDELIRNQALQQLILGLETARDSGQISDETYKLMLSMFLPPMKNPEAEALAAKRNVQPAIPVAVTPSQPRPGEAQPPGAAK
jgi:hypothetical protein